MSLLAIILLIVLLGGGIGTGPYWGYSRGWGHGPSLIFFILLIAAIVAIVNGRV